MQLNWVFDEFFVQPQVWFEVFKPLGIDCKEVLHAKTGKALTTVVQLIIRESEFNLSTDTIESIETCSVCSEKKFLPHVRGYFPSLDGSPEMPIFKSKEFFGSGSDGHKAIIISKELYLLLSSKKIKGILFKPLMK